MCIHYYSSVGEFSAPRKLRSNSQHLYVLYRGPLELAFLLQVQGGGRGLDLQCSSRTPNF